MSAKKNLKGKWKRSGTGSKQQTHILQQQLKTFAREDSIFQGGPNQGFILKSLVAINFFGFLKIEIKMEMAL